MKRLVVVLLFVCAFVPAAHAARTGEVSVVSPGEWLTAGGEATLQWNAQLGEDVEEWEAFLSLDGGAYYGFRVTPHLDAATRSFRFTVPPFASDDARLLLRFGDERRETEFEIPTRFHIMAASPLELLRKAAPVVVSQVAGEAARQGGRPVAQWVEGTRSGEALRTRVRPLPSGLAPIAPPELRTTSISGDLLESNPEPELDVDLPANEVVIERRGEAVAFDHESRLHPLTLSRRLRI